MNRIVHIEVPADEAEAVINLVRNHLAVRGYDVERTYYHLEVMRARCWANCATGRDCGDCEHRQVKT